MGILFFYSALRAEGARKIKSQYAGGILLQPVQKLVAIIISAPSGVEKQTSPVAVPEKIIGPTLILDFFDRCHSLRSLHPPQAALPSLPLPA